MVAIGFGCLMSQYWSVTWALVSLIRTNRIPSDIHLHHLIPSGRHADSLALAARHVQPFHARDRSIVGSNLSSLRSTGRNIEYLGGLVC